LGALYLDLLNLNEGQFQLESALALAQELGSELWLANARSFLALVYAAQGQTRRAADLLGEQQPSYQTMQRLLATASAEVALAERDPNQALRLVDELINTVTETSDGGNVARLAKLRGEALAMLGRSEEAEQSLKAAVRAATEQGALPTVWRAHASIGKVYQTQRRRVEADKEFARARAVAESLAEQIPEGVMRDQYLRGLDRLLPPTRVLSPRAAVKRSYAGLTERERAVASLIAQGRSNSEIAETLVIGKRTVETHISNMLSKLGFTSRAQIVVWALERGLVVGRPD
jgi:DNA-binding NarL/FixJ family response regulator